MNAPSSERSGVDGIATIRIRLGGRAKRQRRRAAAHIRHLLARIFVEYAWKSVIRIVTASQF
jgi:hypothetical protein